MAKERTLDIFWLLGQMDMKRHDVWADLTDEQRAEASPYVLLRWLAGSFTEPEQLVNLADHAAPRVFELGQDRELAFKLLTACTVGGPKRYQWVNFKQNTKRKSKALELIAKTYNMPMRHASNALKLFSASELEELAQAHGWQKDEIAELKKELAK